VNGCHTGYKAGDRYPVAKGLLQSSGFKVLVAGNRYGKGSSREHSPLAEYSAGIRLVIARSFERLYRQNCDNIGLITSTDFSLIDRIKAGEAIEMAELTAGRDKLAAAPHFSKEQWQMLSDPAFGIRVYEYYGKQAYFEGGRALQPTGQERGKVYPNK